MLDSLFQFLFEHRRFVFEQGEFRLSPVAGSYAALLVAAAAILFVLFTYKRARALAAIRIALIALVAFCLMRPVLVVKAAVAQQNFLAVLIDDSRSMQIADHTGAGPNNARRGPRGDFAKQEFADRNAGLLKSLSDKFVVRTFRFSSQPARMASTAELTLGGIETRLGAALDGARQELAGLPLAGMVLISDGADTTDAALSDAVLSLKAAALPVFTIGVGQDQLERDIQVDRVSSPRQALKGTSLLIDVVIRQTGYSGETVSLDVEDEGRIVGTQQVNLPADGEPVSARVRVMAGEAGPRLLTFKVSPRNGETITQNNKREALINIVDRAERILFYEGQPRPEMKFLRRAVEGDKNLHLVTLVRTAESKYFRFGIDDPEHLAGGFPRTREELFAYRGLILGSVEASAFTGDQLRMIAEFVEKRGGGLIMLGGPRSFSEGGFAGTPVADVLPVVLDRAAKTAAGEQITTHLQVRSTRAGDGHAVTQIAATEEASTKRWPELPTLTTVNPIRSIKPGATVLLSGQDEGRRDFVVLASQRYGRGKAIAQTVQDSWLWQMSAKMTLEDQTHENYWRQMLRWLVDGVPDAVDVHTVAERVGPGEPMTIIADVVDKTFLELNDAKVVAHVRRPNGTIEDVPMQWTGEQDGEYRATMTTKEEGLYVTDVEATRGQTAVGRGVTQVRVVPSDAEYFDATMQAARLTRIAEETGGKFYKASAAAGLAEDVQYSGRGVTTIEERELWHMPIILFALLALMFTEWGLRRRSGLA